LKGNALIIGNALRSSKSRYEIKAFGVTNSARKKVQFELMTMGQGKIVCISVALK
jgi:hypothetical protein